MAANIGLVGLHTSANQRTLAEHIVVEHTMVNHTGVITSVATNTLVTAFGSQSVISFRLYSIESDSDLLGALVGHSPVGTSFIKY